MGPRVWIGGSRLDTSSPPLAPLRGGGGVGSPSFFRSSRSSRFWARTRLGILACTKGCTALCAYCAARCVFVVPHCTVSAMPHCCVCAVLHGTVGDVPHLSLGAVPCHTLCAVLCYAMCAV